MMKGRSPAKSNNDVFDFDKALLSVAKSKKSFKKGKEEGLNNQNQTLNIPEHASIDNIGHSSAGRHWIEQSSTEYAKPSSEGGSTGTHKAKCSLKPTVEKLGSSGSSCAWTIF